MKLLPYLSCLLIALLQAPLLSAAETVDIELPDGNELTLDRYPAAGRRLILWLPSENGFGPGHVAIAEGLASEGIDTWVLRLHSSFMLPPGRQSLDELPGQALLPVLRMAADAGFDQVYLMSSGRGARLALELAYLWQQQALQPVRLLRGLVLFTPHLLEEKVVIGRNAGYLPIARHSNLPLYVIMPEYSTKYARSREIAEQLQQGGSPVYLHQMKRIRGGFQMRADEDLQAVDIEMRQRLPERIRMALDLLARTAAAPLRSGWRPVQKASAPSFRAPRLYPISGQDSPPPLRLKTLDGRVIDLAGLKGEVVLVNFWATWCAPCIEEIPSLSRLVDRMRGKAFRVLAVNIGEQPEAIRRFMQRIPVNFDILLDPESKAVRDWKVYAYPSNYLIDRSGRIRYGYRGALAWDAPEIVGTIQSLLDTAGRGEAPDT
jgi:thiol-disulfide isomerase/thioredoxin